MEIVHENLVQPKELPVMIVVTTNAIVTPQGRLVMGRGAALEVKTKYPEIATQCGRAIQRHFAIFPQMQYQTMYGFLEIRPWTRPGKAGFGIFQVKRHFKDSARIELINYSCQVLSQWIRGNEFDCPVRMNFPGIGNGKLKRETVEPILWAHFKHMPVTVCVKG
jgi:hypothetical protein